MDLQQGFLLTRHWRDTPAGTQVEFWLATDNGPRHIRLPYQPSVAFIPAEQREQAEMQKMVQRGVVPGQQQEQQGGEKKSSNGNGKASSNGNGRF